MFKELSKSTDIKHSYQAFKTENECNMEKMILSLKSNKVMILSTEEGELIKCHEFSKTVCYVYYFEVLKIIIIGFSDGYIFFYNIRLIGIYDYDFKVKFTINNTDCRNEITFISIVDVVTKKNKDWCLYVGTATGLLLVYKLIVKKDECKSYELLHTEYAHSSDIILIQSVTYNNDYFLITVSKDGIIKTWTYPTFKIQNCIFLKQNTDIITKGGGGNITSALYIYNYVIVGLDCGIIESWFNPVNDSIIDDKGIDFTYREAHSKRVLSIIHYNQADMYKNTPETAGTLNSRESSRRSMRINKYQDVRQINLDEFFSLGEDNCVLYFLM